MSVSINKSGVRGQESRVFASIDLGTNTVRLLVVESNKKGFKRLHSNQAITRLGEGLSNGGILIDKAMERTINTVLTFKDEASKYNPSVIWIVATSAVREAKNRSAFIEKIKSVTGLQLEVIPWEEEARMTILGVFSGNLPLPLLSKEGSKGRAIIFDIGGGSTEYVFTEDKKLVNSVGTDLGVVHLSERYITKDPVNDEELKDLENVIADKIKNVKDEINSAFRIPHSALLIGTAGTVTTLAALDLNLYPYDPSKINGYILKLENVKKLLDRLKKMPLKERRNIPALEKGREDLIIPGAVIVIKTMEIFGFDSMMVSDYGLREGIILAKIKSFI
ncbi:MAG: Ppx/GppA family phosphatase [Nitrospinae bacterium]|nr:Ppx/GppA family phosphatase [Nitrospinota bacterium]